MNRALKSFWIGLTGGIGSGKSTVTQILRDQGLTVIDADDLAKKVVAPGTPGQKSVERMFGAEFVDSFGGLNRKKMAELVFKDKAALEKLEGIIHPLVQNEVLRQRDLAEKQGEKLIFYDVPLLFEKNLEKQFDQIIVVSVNPKTQKERLLKSGKFTAEDVVRRIANQMSLSEKEKKATFVLQNNGSLENLREQVNTMIGQFNQRIQNQG